VRHLPASKGVCRVGDKETGNPNQASSQGRVLSFAWRASTSRKQAGYLEAYPGGARGMNKYNARRIYSALCGRTFSSKAEAIRGEELALLERGGVIERLVYQDTFALCSDPKVTIAIDFSYVEFGERVYEDVKGVLTRDFRTKLCWLKEKHDIDVVLIRSV